MRLATLVFAFLLAWPLAPEAQTVEDTTSAWRYVPLALGDAWEYRVIRGFTGGGQPFTVTRSVRGDTLVDGVSYRLIEEKTYQDGPPLPDPSVRRFTARFDTSTSRLEWGGGLIGRAPCPLDVPFPEEEGGEVRIECGEDVSASVAGGYNQTVAIGGSTYSLTAKTIGGTTVIGESSTFAADIGLVGGGIIESPGEEWTLRTARVAGRYIGDGPGSRFPGIPDTTAPARYYPLGVGDTWHRQVCATLSGCTSRSISRVEREEVVNDTVYAVVTGEAYVREGGDWVLSNEFEQLQRVDPISTAITIRHGDVEYVESCPLGADLDVPIVCDQYGGEIQAVAFLYEHPDYGVVKGLDGTFGGASYAPDVGLISASGDASDSVMELVYSNVGGVERGTPFGVSTAPTPEAALRLSATPTLTAGPLAVHVTGARGLVRLEAFDVRGRRVLAREASGDVRLDASAWAPGLYLLRATSGDEAATVRIVRR